MKNGNETWICCLGCDKLFLRTHKGRKFCSEKCYNKDYNENYRDKSRKYLKSLERNKKILEQYKITADEISIPLSELENKKFLFVVYSKSYFDYALHAEIVEFGPYKTYLRADECLIIKLIN